MTSRKQNSNWATKSDLRKNAHNGYYISDPMEFEFDTVIDIYCLLENRKILDKFFKSKKYKRVESKYVWNQALVHNHLAEVTGVWVDYDMRVRYIIERD